MGDLPVGPDFVDHSMMHPEDGVRRRDADACHCLANSIDDTQFHVNIPVRAVFEMIGERRVGRLGEDAGDVFHSGDGCIAFHDDGTLTRHHDGRFETPDPHRDHAIDGPIKVGDEAERIDSLKGCLEL